MTRGEKKCSLNWEMEHIVLCAQTSAEPNIGSSSPLLLGTIERDFEISLGLKYFSFSTVLLSLKVTGGQMALTPRLSLKTM